MKLFQSLTCGFGGDFSEFLHVRIVQGATTHQSHVYIRIKILQTIFGKDHPRNIPVNLLQNLASSFGEDFLIIFLHFRIEQKAPIHHSQCL